MLRKVVELFFILILSLFVIFSVLYNFEEDSILIKHGSNTFYAFLHWFSNFLFYKWGSVHATNQQLVFFQGGNNTLGVFQFLAKTFFYGISGLFLAFTVSTLLTYYSIFKRSVSARRLSSVLNLLSGIHIILYCFIIKIVFAHQEGFHVFILLSIAIGSYTYADIHQYQSEQFSRLFQADFITAARSWGDSILKHARRSITIGLLSQMNSLLGIVFASTIIVEYFFKVRGIGFALDRYLIMPNLLYPSLPVESEFFMLISALVIITVLLLTGIKDIINSILINN